LHFWLIELYNISIGLQENHINPKYNVVIFNDQEADRKFLQRLYATFGQKRVSQMIFLLSIWPDYSSSQGKLVPQPYGIGQKLIPMNVSDVQNPFDIGYRTWREVYVNERVSDLVANFVCGSFSIMIDWMYIKSSKPGLFDNDEQQRRLEVSDRARVVIAKLRETQRLTADDTEVVLPSVGAELEAPIYRIESKVLISNVTMGILAENVGRTFFDIPLLEKGSKVWLQQVGPIMHDHAVFKKYVFDLCYGLASLNTKLGVTHSDLHLNNMVININSLYTPAENSTVAYGLNKKWYTFDCNGHYAYIIDFSRSTVHPDYISEYLVENKNYMNKVDVESFRNVQNERMISTLKGHFPNFYQTRMQELHQTMQLHFDKFYRLYTMVDVYSLSDKMYRHFQQHKCIKPNLDLLNKMRRASEYYLTTGMNKLFLSPDIEIDWPIFDVVAECFSDNLSSENDTRALCDVWSLDRPLTYSLRRYELWPPYIAHILEMETEGSTPKKHKLFQSQIAMRKAFENYRHAQIKTVRLIADRHKLKYA
jgi:hypothetical protein